MYNVKKSVLTLLFFYPFSCSFCFLISISINCYYTFYSLGWKGKNITCSSSWMELLTQGTMPIENGLSWWSGCAGWNGFRIWFLPASGRGRRARQRIQFYIGRFSSSSFSFSSTQSAHRTHKVHKFSKCVRNQGMYPIFTMHFLSPFIHFFLYHLWFVYLYIY